MVPNSLTENITLLFQMFKAEWETSIQSE